MSRSVYVYILGGVSMAVIIDGVVYVDGVAVGVLPTTEEAVRVVDLTYDKPRKYVIREEAR